MTDSCSKSYGCIALIGAIVVITVALGHGSSPIFWRVSTQSELLRGEIDQVSVDFHGQLILGPSTDIIYETTSPFFWTATRIGQRIWIGSGNDGKVFSVSADGTADISYDSAEQNVHAVTAAGRNSAYIGTSPDGQVLRVSQNTVQAVFNPDEKYIWAIAVATDQTVFVGTGESGRIYQIHANGESSLFYDTEATHVLSLDFDRSGNLLASTGTPGRIFRITREGQAFVVFDSPFKEIRALHPMPDGSLYSVAVNLSTRNVNTPTKTNASGISGTEIASTATSVATSPNQSIQQSSQNSSGSQNIQGAVYLIEPDGVWDVVWESNVDTPYDVTVDFNGHLLVGTGNNGKIFRVIDNPRRVVLVTQAPAKQITSFVPSNNEEIYYVTANPAKVVKLSKNRSSTGTYLSEVRDTETITTWGTISWQASTPEDSLIRLFTRSGNTVPPNSTWSPWSEAYTNPDGSQITSPKARYIQWRANLSGTTDTPKLLSVTTAYLPQNLRPKITNLRLHEPGIVFQRSLPSGNPPIAGFDKISEARAEKRTNPYAEQRQSSLGRSAYQKGMQTFAWSALDPNNDQLLFELFYKSETETAWTSLGKDLIDNIFTWDTTSTPDGTYVIRIVASDTPSNAPGQALIGSDESAPFDIDNSPPNIRIEELRPYEDNFLLPFVVTDSHSPVQHVEFSLDTKSWQVIYPVDGIPDSRLERFELPLDPPSVSNLIIRATDAMNNIVTTSGQN